MIVDIEKEPAQEVVKEIQSRGRKSLFFEADVARWDQVKAMVEGVLKDFNRVDILINNAGIVGPVVPVWEYRVEDWDRVMEINEGDFSLLQGSHAFHVEREKWTNRQHSLYRWERR